MKKAFMFMSMLAILSLLLGACTQGTATPTEAATEPAADVPGDVPATEPPTQAPAETEAPVLITIDLVGPPMEVGSKFMYVDGSLLVAVPGGPFTMGYNFADNPERVITVGDFWIYANEVTNGQYALCVQLEKCAPPDPEKATTYGDVALINFPVTGVTHDQAAAYCAFVKGRLPTEAEWEKAARGPDGNVFPWGNGAPNCSLTNYANCKGKTTPVNDYPNGKSYYELWDMSGNIREWVADWYEPLYNVENPVADPLGPTLGERRSVRGAGFADSANATIAAFRFSLDPEESLLDLGFRCVVEDPFVFAPWCEMVGYAGIGPDGSPANCTPEVKCNDISITVVPSCDPVTQSSYTIVTFELSKTPPDGWAYAASGCAPIGGEQTPTKDKFLCTPPGPVGPATATGSCTDVNVCAATCPMNYKKVGDTCVWEGGSYGGTECLPGSTYDPLTQCCSAIPGLDNTLKLCPAGFFNLNGVCVPNPKGAAPVLSENITLIPSCAVPTDDPNDPGDDPGDSGGPCPPPKILVCTPPSTYSGAQVCTCQNPP